MGKTKKEHIIKGIKIMLFVGLIGSILNFIGFEVKNYLSPNFLSSFLSWDYLYVVLIYVSVAVVAGYFYGLYNYSNEQKVA